MYLRKALQYFELIIVDDGSTDETASLIAPFISSDIKSKLHPSKKTKEEAMLEMWELTLQKVNTFAS